MGNLFPVPLAAQSPSLNRFIGGRKVPSLGGKSPQEANEKLKEYDLIGVLVGTEPSPNNPPGTVNHQDPPAGAPIPYPGIVRYWLAAGPVPSSGGVTSSTNPPPPNPSSADKAFVIVPYLKGLELKKGLADLKTLRLVGQVAGKEVSKWQVGAIANQDLAAGSRVRPGATVKISVSLGPSRSKPTLDDWKSYPRNIRLGMAVVMGALTATVIVYLFRSTPPIPSSVPKVELVLVKDRGEQEITAPGPLIEEVSYRHPKHET